MPDASELHSPLVAHKKKHVTFWLLVCGNFRTSSKGTVSRVLLRYRLRNVESDSTCCRRRLRGMSPSRVSAHLCSYSVTRRSSAGRTEETAVRSAGVHTHEHTRTAWFLRWSLLGAITDAFSFFLHLLPLLLFLLGRGHAPLDGSRHKGLCSQVAVTHAVTESSHTLFIPVAFS